MPLRNAQGHFVNKKAALLSSAAFIGRGVVD